MARGWGDTISAKNIIDIHRAKMLSVCLYISVYLNDNQELQCHSKCIVGETLSLQESLIPYCIHSSLVFCLFVFYPNPRLNCNPKKVGKSSGKDR